MRLIDADALKMRDISPEAWYSPMWGLEQIDIDDAPTIEIPKWIPVTERLPKEKGEYLVTYHPCYWDDVRDAVLVGIDMFRGKTTWAKMKHQRVIAWMPLPKAYKEGE